MSDHLPLRSSVASRSSAFPSHPAQHPHPHPRRDPDPLASTWIRRLHLTPPPPHLLLPRSAPPSPPLGAASSDESRTLPPPPLPPPRRAGFGPFRWSSQPAGDWDGGGGAGGPTLSPFFRLPRPAAQGMELGELVSAPLAAGNGGGMFPGLSRRIVVAGDPPPAWLPPRAAGAAYPSHAVDTTPTRTPHDLHDIQHIMMPQHFPRLAPGSTSQHDEPFSYWNMGRFPRNTTTSSVSPIAAASANSGKKRNAGTNGFLPLKFRKRSGLFDG